MLLLSEDVWIVLSGCSSALSFACCLRWRSAAGRFVFGSGRTRRGKSVLLVRIGTSMSLTKGLISLGRSTGGSCRCLGGYIPLEGPSAGLSIVLTYLVVRIVSLFSSNS